ALAAAVGALALVPAAAAGQPAKDSFTQDSFVISGSCAFDVNLDVVAGKESVKTFSDGRQLITGQLKVQLTNTDNPQKSLTVNISGPGFAALNAPSTATSRGSSLGPVPGQLLLVHGRVQLDLDADGNLTGFTITSASAAALCPALA